MAQSSGSDRGGGPTQSPTLADAWPGGSNDSGQSNRGAKDDAGQRSPKSGRGSELSDVRAKVTLNAIEPSRPQQRSPASVLGRAERFAQQQLDLETKASASRSEVPIISAPDRFPARPSLPEVPQELRSRYVGQGRNWYSQDGKLAFTVRDARFTTPREDNRIVEDLVVAAQANGWGSVTVTGTERWRRRAWREASLAGLDVKGYEPSVREKEHLIRDIARQANLRMAARTNDDQAVEPRTEVDSTGSQSRSSSNHAPAHEVRGRGQSQRTLVPWKARMNVETMAGRLIEHGAATYRFREDESPSYFVKILTPDGKRTFWGVGLKEAIEESESKIKTGDQVALRRVGKRPVTIVVEQRDASGKVQKVSLETERVDWRVESPEWFAKRAKHARMLRDDHLEAARAARQDPELARTIMAMKAGELFSDQEIPDAKERARFNSAVAARLQREAQQGKPAPTPSLRSRSSERTPGSDKTKLERDDLGYHR